MIAAEMQRQVAKWGPAFRLPLEALSAIEAQHGHARMLDHALQANDEHVRFMALLLDDARLAINLMTDLVRAQQSSKPSRIKRIQRRLAKALGAAKLRAEAMTLEKWAAGRDEVAKLQPHTMNTPHNRYRRLDLVRGLTSLRSLRGDRSLRLPHPR